MESIAVWFANSLGQFMPAEVVIFIISMIPILELRGGLVVASLLQVPLLTAIPICIIGNIIPIPFILLFIKKIFAWMRKWKFFAKIVDKLEAKAMRKSEKITQGAFWGLLLFVGIPLPATGAWTGSLIAALLQMDLKKSVLSIFLGRLLAAVIVSIFSYGLLGILF